MPIATLVLAWHQLLFVIIIQMKGCILVLGASWRHNANLNMIHVPLRRRYT